MCTIQKGVNITWEWLEDSYGSPEIIEHALLQRLDNFPRTFNKDNQCLRELGTYFWRELAKSEDHLLRLTRFDTAQGVNAIVEKLPYGLQERWIMQGSKYKEDHHATIGPSPEMYTSEEARYARRVCGIHEENLQ